MAVASTLPTDFSSTPAVVLQRRYHFHAPGLIYLFLTVLLVIGAINGQNNLLFWAFGLAVGAMLVSGFISGAILMGVEVRPSVVAGARAGQPLRLRYEISNRNRLMPAFGLLIEELAPDEAASRTRLTGDANWPRFFRRPVGFVSHIPARGRRVVEVETVPWRRGRLVLARFRISSTFPFGLTLKSVVFESLRTAVVTPWAAPVDAAVVRRAVRSGSAFEGGGRVRSDHGEFFSLRPYRGGDDRRAIAWKRSARSDTLVVREHASGRPASVWIVAALPLDPEASALRSDPANPDHEHEVERAISLAAGMSGSLASGEQAWGLLSAAGEILVRPAVGRPQVHRLMDTLAVLGTDGDPSRERWTRLPMVGRASLTRDVFVAVGGGAISASLTEAGASRLDPSDPRLLRSDGWDLMPRPAGSEHSAAGEARTSTGLRRWWQGVVADYSLLGGPGGRAR